MAIVPMKHVELYGLIRHKSSFLSELQRLGLVEISPMAPEEVTPEHSADLNHRLTEIDERLAEISRVLAIFERFAPQKPNLVEQFAGMKTVITWEEQQNYLAEKEKVEELCRAVFHHEEEYSSLEQTRGQLEREITELLPWKELDLPRQAWKGSPKIQILLGSVEGNLDALREALAEEEIPFCAYELGAFEQRTYLVLFLLRADKAEEIIRNKGFMPFMPEIPEGTVGAYLNSLIERKGEVEERLGTLKQKIEVLAEQQRPLFQTFYDYWYNLKLQVEADRRLLLGKDVFALAGWVEAEQAKRVEQVLSTLGYPYYLRFRDPEAGEEIPIALKNSKLARPFEALVEAFNYPHQDEVDPSAAIGPFFFLCYGMALGDAGYGLVLALICTILLHKMTMRPRGKKMARLMILSGLGAVLVGLLTSSIFAFAPYQGIFSVTDNPQLLLIISLGLGLFQLYVGTIISAWISIRQGKWADAIWEKGFWLLFLTGLLLSVGAPTLGLGAYTLHFRYGTVIAAALLVLGNVRGKKGIFARIMAIPGGLLNIYNSVGFFSDVLSYSRLMALGLSGAVMGSIINLFVEMTWGLPGIGWLFSIIIFLFGHALNMGLNVLGAYVHSSRLQYLEFFGTFFGGGGRPFSPLKIENINIFLKREREV